MGESADGRSVGSYTVADLIPEALRQNLSRLIVGEVRGPEAFDLLQAMNTGHDGSMGTLHANSPREALSRMESMITMGGFSLPAKTIREIIVAAVDVVIQAQRLRDGSRRITQITEVLGLEGGDHVRLGVAVPGEHGELDRLREGATTEERRRKNAPGKSRRAL